MPQHLKDYPPFIRALSLLNESSSRLAELRGDLLAVSEQSQAMPPPKTDEERAHALLNDPGAELEEHRRALLQDESRLVMAQEAARRAMEKAERDFSLSASIDALPGMVKRAQAMRSALQDFQALMVAMNEADMAAHRDLESTGACACGAFKQVRFELEGLEAAFRDLADLIADAERQQAVFGAIPRSEWSAGTSY